MPKPDDYDARCSEWARTDEDVPVWLGLRAILGDRPGWYFTPPGTDGQAAWCFGLAGEARLVADAVEGMCHLYNHDRDSYSDSDLIFDEPGAFEAWLAEHEAEHEGLSPLGRELFGDLLPGKVEEWSREQEGGP